MDRDHRYDDIISLGRPPSPGHPPMSRQSRAAQFSPFAALTGYEAAIEEAARWTDSRVDLGDEALSRLDAQLRLLKDMEAERPMVTVTCFRPDASKPGGQYETLRGRLKRIREDEGFLLLTNGKRVDFQDLMNIEPDADANAAPSTEKEIKP